MPFVIPFPDIDPALFTISIGSFQFSLRWYALAYIAGLLIGWRLMVYLMKRPVLWPGTKAPLKPEEPEELLTWMVLGVVLGGRLGYVVFYDPARFIAKPSEILQVWEGGMSFHGGFLGVILATVFYARAKRAPLLQIADAVALAAPVGLFLGRVANFINGELYGRVTDVSWAMQFPLHDPLTGARDWNNLTEPRHPSQLYEAALEGFLLFLVMWILALNRRWLMTPGMLTGVFFIGYGAARFFVEYFREPDPQLIEMVRDYGVSMGQILSLPMIFIGVGFMVIARGRRPA